MPTRTDQAFPRTMRLLKADDYSSVFVLRSSRSNRYFQVWSRPNGLDHGRVGVVAAKKIDKRAVGRNRAKRLVRELFRSHRVRFAGFDLVVRAKIKLHRADCAPARLALQALFEHLAPCRASSSS